MAGEQVDDERLDVLAFGVGQPAPTVGPEVRGELVDRLQVGLDGAGRFVASAEVALEGSRQVVYAVCCHGPLHSDQTGHLEACAVAELCGERALCSPPMMA
jgi:hypothetical protein